MKSIIRNKNYEAKQVSNSLVGINQSERLSYNHFQHLLDIIMSYLFVKKKIFQINLVHFFHYFYPKSNF